MTEHLKPCPFCGNDGSGPIEDALQICEVDMEGQWKAPMAYSVQCDKCTATMGYSESIAEAVEAWNTRAAMQPTPQMQCIHMTAEMAANCPTCNPSALRRLPTGVVEVCPICDIAGCHHIRERNAASYTMTPQQAAKVLADNFDTVWTKAIAIDSENARETASRNKHKWPVICREGARAALHAIASEDSK